MNLLLDTHVVLWWLSDDPTLSDPARGAIADGNNTVFVSAASVWEIRIKAALGKLDLPPQFREVLQEQPFLFLDVTADHAHAQAGLPSHHRDPFDRMLVAQCVHERLTLVSRDAAIRPYGVPTIDA